MRRVVANWMINVSLNYTFVLAYACGINSGIITSIFASSMIYVGIVFYFKFGQKMSKVDIFGIVLMVGCIVCISLAKTKTEESNTFSWEKFGAIMSAIVVGLIFTANSLDL